MFLFPRFWDEDPPQTTLKILLQFLGFSAVVAMTTVHFISGSFEIVCEITDPERYVRRCAPFQTGVSCWKELNATNYRGTEVLLHCFPVYLTALTTYWYNIHCNSLGIGVLYFNGPLKSWSHDQGFLMMIITLLCIYFNHASFDPASLNVVIRSLQAIDPKKSTGEGSMDLFSPLHLSALWITESSNSHFWKHYFYE